MGETRAKKSDSQSSLSFVFVHSHGERKRLPAFHQPLPLWTRLKLLVKYYSIQWRWDIERGLARLFNRRWGG
jgi:hypothetical protein